MSEQLSQGILWEVVQASEPYIVKVTEIPWDLLILQSLNRQVEPELLHFYAATRNALAAALKSIYWGEETKNMEGSRTRATWRGEKPPNTLSLSKAAKRGNERWILLHPDKTDSSLRMCEPGWAVLHHLGVAVLGGLGKMDPFSSLLE